MIVWDHRQQAMITNASTRLQCVLLPVALLLGISSLRAEPPVKVYILAGQSNMQGKGPIEGEAGNSLRHMVLNDSEKEFHMFLNDEGEWAER